VTFGLPIAPGTLLGFAGALAALTVLAYVLRMRRRQFEVPFSALWQRVLRDTQATSLWRRLKRLVSLLIQLVILALLVVAAADPRLGGAPADARNVVVIVDASASMKARDADADRARIDEALERAHDLIAALGAGDAAMIVRMDGRTTPMSRFESDKAALHRAVDRIRATDTPADLRRALTAATDALRDRQHPMVVIIGDGGYAEDALADATWDPPQAGAPVDKRLAAIELAGIDVRYLPVGSSAANFGIVAFNVRRYVTNKLSYEVFVELQNFGDRPASAELTLYSGRAAVDVHPLALGPGERVQRIYPDLGGGDGHRLRAALRVDTPDADRFPLDDKAFALLPKRSRQDVLLVTSDNLYLEGALLVYDNVRVDKLPPAQYELALATDELQDYDVVIFDGYTPAGVPEGAHLVYFGPAGEHSPFPIVRTLPGARITEVNDAHPVMQWAELGDVNIDVASVFALEPARGEQWLARSVRAPVIAALKQGARKVLAFGFGLNGTDLVLRVAFPLILANALDWLAGDDADLVTTYATGHRFRVPIDATVGATEARVLAPDGHRSRAPLADGRATFYAASVGIHRIEAPGATVELAANLANPAESSIRPARALRLGGRELAPPPAFAASPRRAIWPYLVLAAVALLLLEWLTYNRRLTV
jgi:hypothetical protein